ncbi:MAG: T9SS type A sorting domain-containing protein [candidate division WOR-3 bacterium]
MKKLSIILVFACVIWAVTVPANIDKAKMDDGTGSCDRHVPVMVTRDIVAADSSANEYSLWTQMQTSLAYEPIDGYLEFVCRNFVTSGNLDVWQNDNIFSGALTDVAAYAGDLGPARYPTAVGSIDGSGPHISFPYLISGAWGGMGGQYESGGWFSSFWDAPVDIGPGNIATHKNNGIQLGNGNILFISVTDANVIYYRTYSADLGTPIASGTVATNYYWGYDCNGGTAYVFYYDDALNVYYKSSTDGVNWSAEQTWTVNWPNPYTSNIIGFTQVAVTDAGNPILVFDNWHGDDYGGGLYPYRGKIYVSTASGANCIEVGNTASDARCFYPTIAAEGNYVVVLFGQPRSGTGQYTFWDVYYNYSTNNGSTWSTPRNLTGNITDHNNSLWQIAKRLDPAGNGQLFFVFGCAIADPLLDLYWNINNGSPTAARWYVGRNPIIGIAENKTETPKKLALNVAPNPVRNQTGISYALPKTGSVSINLYTADGRLVQKIDQGNRNAGFYTVTLDTRELANGAYVVVLKTDKKTVSGKLVVTH